MARHKVTTSLHSCPDPEANRAHSCMWVTSATVPFYARRISGDIDKSTRLMAGQKLPAAAAPPPPVAHPAGMQPNYLTSNHPEALALNRGMPQPVAVPSRVANTPLTPCLYCRSPTGCQPGCPVRTEAARATNQHIMSGPQHPMQGSQSPVIPLRGQVHPAPAPQPGVS